METIVLALMVCLVKQSFPTESAIIPLSMMDQLVDDMYDRCSDAMAEKVKKTYFPTEMKSNELFKKFADMETTVLALTRCLVMSSFLMESVQLIPLTMMENSIDDMYSGCKDSMAGAVDNVYFPRENNIDPFKDGWKIAAHPALRKYENRPDEALTLQQVQAIYVYSQEFPNVYSPFNGMVREGKAEYGTKDFPYHALHFWLTTALQIISANKPCQTTYRRSKDKYTGKVHDQIRFGQFASSTKDPNLITLGTETCFYINTCDGANIKSYKSLDEDEVLIPPYETFKITGILEGSYKEMKDCKRVFVLKNTGNLNCKATAPKANFN